MINQILDRIRKGECYECGEYHPIRHFKQQGTYKPDSIVNIHKQRFSYQVCQKCTEHKVFMETKFLFSLCYEVVDEQSVKIGDFSDTGFEIEAETHLLEDILQVMEEYGITASEGLRTPDAVINYQTGEHTTYSAFISEVSGRPIDPKVQQRIYDLMR